MNLPALSFSPTLSPKIAYLVGLIFICLLPFSGALEIHHVFAEVDHDGHEHSDFDLCQWVQQHANGLLVLEKPIVESLPLHTSKVKVGKGVVGTSFLTLSIHSPRPPPFSSFTI